LSRVFRPNCAWCLHAHRYNIEIGMICMTRTTKNVIVNPKMIQTQWNLDGVLLNSFSRSSGLSFFQCSFIFLIVQKKLTFMQNEKTINLNSSPILTVKRMRFSKMHRPTWFPIYPSLFSNFQIRNISNWSRETRGNPWCHYIFKKLKMPITFQIFCESPENPGIFLIFFMESLYCKLQIEPIKGWHFKHFFSRAALL